MNPLWFMFLVLQAFLNLEFSWSQNVNTCEIVGLDPHLYVSGLTQSGGTMRPGHKLRFVCGPGYQLDGSKEIECLPTGQWNISFPSCSAFCEKLSDPRLIVRADMIKERYLAGDVVQYACTAPGAYEEGNATCENGKWTKSEECPGTPCEVDPLSDGLRHFGSAPQSNLVNPGGTLRFWCGDEYDMEGSDEVRCLDTGKWDAPFPTCSEKCRIPDIPETVRITSSLQGNAISKGDQLLFACQPGLIMTGSSTSSCLGNGKWSTPVPECAAVEYCSAPPTLEDGDTKSFLRWDAVYQTGEKVEYICQNKYIMQGDQFKTCDNGEWKGNMRCLKPCTVNEELLRNHGLQFRFPIVDKLYAIHQDHLTFVCARGKRPVGNVPMRVQCNDGQMTLPTCR